MNKRKLILSSAVANTFEWYDYALFGHFAPIIAQKYFPNSDPSTALLKAFMVFAIGYLMRPIGGIFFGIIGDRFGRKVALSSAIICMAFPTAAIGFLPTYDSLGIMATTLMIMVRMLQGLSMGGALTGSVSFVIEHTEKKHRGFIASIPMASICIGILLGSTVSYITQIALPPEAFYEWGWRLPFLVGIIIFFAGIYIRKYTEETPLFEDARYRGEIVRFPLKEVLQHYWPDMIISIMINSTGSVIFYLEAIYLMSYLKINRGFEPYQVNLLINICYIIMAVVTLLSGLISDYMGRKRIFYIILVSIFLLIPVLMDVIENGNFMSVVCAQIVIAIIAAAYIGPEPALQAEFYPTNVRNTALSVSYNTATSIFGGMTPYAIELLVQSKGTITSSVYYILACSGLSIIGLYFYKDRSLLDHKVSIVDN